MTTKLAPHAEVVAKNRYYLKNDKGETVEDGNALFKRVAQAVAAVENLYLTLPIVCTPEQAYRCFMRTEMDTLVLENFIIDKKDQKPLEGDQNWKEEFELD